MLREECCERTGCRSAGCSYAGRCLAVYSAGTTPEDLDLQLAWSLGEGPAASPDQGFSGICRCASMAPAPTAQGHLGRTGCRQEPASRTALARSDLCIHDPAQTKLCPTPPTRGLSLAVRDSRRTESVTIRVNESRDPTRSPTLRRVPDSAGSRPAEWCGFRSRCGAVVLV